MKKNIIIVVGERMANEGRVALMPVQCAELVKLGHKVYVEQGAGEKSGYEDSEYIKSGAEALPIEEIVPFLQSKDTVVLKVKQPLPEDDVWFKQMKNGVLFAYFHSTGEKDSRTIDTLLKNKITAISYELLQSENGEYPVLVPMSKIAGWRAVSQGIELLGEARTRAAMPSVPNRHVCMMVIGAGTVGLAAIEEGLGLGFSSITVFDRDPEKEKNLRAHFPHGYSIKFYSPSCSHYHEVFKREISNTHILIGAVLVPGGHAPLVVSEEQVTSMGKGRVIVDVAVDQGGCIWCPPGKEGLPVFWDNMLYFCRIPNMPGAVPREATPALSKALFPYLLQVVGVKDLSELLKNNPPLQKGVIVFDRKTMNRLVAEHHGKEVWEFVE